MVERPRRKSKLRGEHPAEQETDRADEKEEVPEETSAEEEQDEQAAEFPKPVIASALQPPVTRNPRRLRVVGKVTDSDMVSFNCKMSRGLRRSVRHFAADAEVDIQDVVAAALAEYLAARGVAVPGSELRQPG